MNGNLPQVEISFEEACQHPQFRNIPEDVLRGIYNYVDLRLQPGQFLGAVLRNDLFGAVGRADSRSLAALQHIVTFIHCYVPAPCHGSQDAIRAWCNSAFADERAAA